MTVRWKPLIVLSVLFVIVAAMGLLAITYALPGKAEDILPRAQASAKAKRFADAEIHYRQALQRDPKNFSVHEELAEMYGRWAAEAPEIRVELRNKRLKVLSDAARYGKSRPGPRQALVADYLAQDDLGPALVPAEELLTLDAKNTDANYVKALEALDKQPADTVAAKKYLAVLTKSEPTKVRTLWVRARMARESGDEAAMNEALDQARGVSLDPKAPTSERVARLRLRLLEIARNDDPKTLAPMIEEFASEAKSVASEPDPSPSRIRLLSAMLEGVQKHLSGVGARIPTAKVETAALSDRLESVSETIFTKALETYGATDLRAHLGYAEHLMFRGQNEKALDVATQALKRPVANLPAWEGTAAALRETAIKAALAQVNDPARMDKAAPFIADLIKNPNARYSALGHFFKGLIALEKSGLTAAAGSDPGAETAAPTDPKLREEAVSELRKAAAGLPDAATAQALYGVALVLTGETSFGRQYLQDAYRLGADGRLEPRYQVWAAWSILQAGYPEEAEPIVTKLREGVARGEIPGDLGVTLHLLQAEIHQARRTPDQLKLARDEFEKAIETGKPISPALAIRLAQLDIQLGDQKQGMERLEKLKNDPRTGAAAERLVVLGLKESGKLDDAKKALAAARAKFPDSDELAELDAVFLSESKDAAGAEKVLADHLAKHPGGELALFRARLLAGPLNKPDEARKLLIGLAETAENSAPLVQLAMVDLGRKDYDAVARTIAKIRARWKEAAAADLLDAQLALAKEDPRAAGGFLDAALKKDPNNKVAQFWKALIDERTGSQSRSTQALETILKDQPVKEIGAGLSLTTAARWALADQALQNRNLDDAISRFEGMLKPGDTGELDRAIRWKLVSARAAKGQIAEAKAEVARLVAAPVTTPEERVQAADFYRRYDDEAACMVQVDAALKQKPYFPGAVAYKALALAGQNKDDAAAATIRQAITSSTQPPNMYLVLAAIENRRKPVAEGPTRALKALEDGLAKYPDALDLIQAKYQVLVLKKDPGAVAFVEARAKADPRPEVKKVLAEVYREERAYDKAESVVREVLAADPSDAKLTSILVGLISTRAAEASDKGDRGTEAELNKKLVEVIRAARARFPLDMSFPQAECELATRTGDLGRAKQVCAEITEKDPASPTGPILRARIYAAEGRIDEVANAYEEALARNPRRDDVRLAFAQAKLALGKCDETLQQTKLVLDSQRDSRPAILLKAQALTIQAGTPEEIAARRTEAAKILNDAIAADPKFIDAYHLVAEVRMIEKDRERALKALRGAIAADPNDDTGLSSLVQHLCEPRGPNEQAPVAAVQEAMKLAEEFGARDERGVFALALAVGFQRAGKTDLALPWAEKAAKKIDRPIVHLTYGDILLARAETTTPEGAALELFSQAADQYGLVLKVQPNSVQATNNRAWILHRYLKKNPEAQELAETLVKRADPASLPPEFFDTLGAIQEAMGTPRKAEDSYSKGLRKDPKNAILNYHMGRLLASDRTRSSKARPYLEKARDAKTSLAPDMIAEVETLLSSSRP